MVWVCHLLVPNLRFKTLIRFMKSRLIRTSFISAPLRDDEILFAIERERTWERKGGKKVDRGGSRLNHQANRHCYICVTVAGTLCDSVDIKKESNC